MVENIIIQIILYLTAVFTAVLSIVVFSRGLKEYKNIIFGLFTTTATAWTLAIIGFYFPPFPNININWVEYTHSFAIITSVLFLFFTIFFPQNLLRNRTYALLIPVFILFYFITLIFSSDLVVGETNGLSYALGPMYIWYAAALMSGFFGGYYFLIKQLVYARNPMQRRQTLYVAIGAVISPTLAIIPTLIFPYFGVYSFTWTGPIFTVIMVIFIFLAMIRLRLFNVKIIFTEIFTTLIIIILLAQLFVAENIVGLVITTAVLVIVSIASYLLIRSVYREIEQKEEIERLAKSLERANERLRELDKMKSQFLSIASHDLRAPLTAIRNFMSLLLDGTYGKLPPAAEDGMKQVFDRTTGMADMVDNYLNVSRIEQGRMKYDFANTDMLPILKETIQAFTPVAEKKQLSLALSTNENALPMRADASKMREVFENLISNAINYTEKGGITVTADRVGARAKIVFSDTGIGMSKETIAKLFGLFNQGENSRKYNPKSTGVGLYITKAHIEAHKGTVRAESDGEGKGSRFIVEIPLR